MIGRSFRFRGLPFTRRHFGCILRYTWIIGGSATSVISSACIDTEIVNRLCKVLDGQPGDIMEYVPDEE